MPLTWYDSNRLLLRHRVSIHAAASMMALVSPRCHRYLHQWFAVYVITAANAAPSLADSYGESCFCGSTLPAQQEQLDDNF